MTPIIAAVAQENLHAGDLLEIDPATGFAVKATPGRVPGKWRQRRRKPIMDLQDVIFMFPVKGSCPVCHTPLIREYAIRVRGDRGDATGYRQPAHQCGEMIDDE